MKRESTLSELCLEMEEVLWYCRTERDGSVYVTVGQRTLQINMFCAADYLIYVCLINVYFILGLGSQEFWGEFNLTCAAIPQRYIPCHSIGYRYYICMAVKRMLHKIHVISYVSNARESILIKPTRLILFYLPHSFTGRLMQGADQTE